MQINFQCFSFDRDVGVFVVFGGGSVTCCRDSPYPGAAVAKKSDPVPIK